MGSSFWQGMASLLDFPGLFAPRLPIRENDQDALFANWQVIAQDFRVVGQDLSDAIAEELSRRAK